MIRKRTGLVDVLLDQSLLFAAAISLFYTIHFQYVLYLQKTRLFEKTSMHRKLCQAAQWFTGSTMKLRNTFAKPWNSKDGPRWMTATELTHFAFLLRAWKLQHSHISIFMPQCQWENNFRLSVCMAMHVHARVFNAISQEHLGRISSKYPSSITEETFKLPMPQTHITPNQSEKAEPCVT